MELPVDHRLAGFYRVSAGIAGVGLAAFGVIGFILTWSEPWLRYGESLLGLTTNNPINLVSVVFGVALLVAALAGGQAPSLVNIGVGSLFILNGLFWMCVIRTPSVNVLHFTMTNVVFTLIAGTIILTCGLYGREPANQAQKDLAQGHPEATRGLTHGA